MDYKTEVVIIGGGATGAGIPRNLALRGIPSILVERGDFTSGASGRWKVVHPVQLLRDSMKPLPVTGWDIDGLILRIDCFRPIVIAKRPHFPRLEELVACIFVGVDLF